MNVHIINYDSADSSTRRLALAYHECSLIFNRKNKARIYYNTRKYTISHTHTTSNMNVFFFFLVYRSADTRINNNYTKLMYSMRLIKTKATAILFGQMNTGVGKTGFNHCMQAV